MFWVEVIEMVKVDEIQKICESYFKKKDELIDLEKKIEIQMEECLKKLKEQMAEREIFGNADYEYKIKEDGFVFEVEIEIDYICREDIWFLDSFLKNTCGFPLHHIAVEDDVMHICFVREIKKGDKK